MPEGFLSQDPPTGGPVAPPQPVGMSTGLASARVLSPFKALRTLRKTHVLLSALLRGVTQVQAVAATDGPNGWSVLYIVCHLRDYETFFSERVGMMLDQNNPSFTLPGTNDELVVNNTYARQDLRLVLADYIRLRQMFITRLEGLTDDQWRRPGQDPRQGATTVLELAVNVGLHDVDHLEQIARCLKMVAG